MHVVSNIERSFQKLQYIKIESLIGFIDNFSEEKPLLLFCEK